MELTQDNILRDLRGGPCQVTFTKVNGDARVMNCTLDQSLIPEAKMPKGDNTPELTEGLDRILKAVRVFDMGLEEWRSFKVECVTNFVKSY